MHVPAPRNWKSKAIPSDALITKLCPKKLFQITTTLRNETLKPKIKQLKPNKMMNTMRMARSF